MNLNGEVIATLDLGTTKVSVLAGELGPTESRVLGIRTAGCEGLCKGMIISIEKTVEAIRRAKHDAVAREVEP